MTRHEADVLGGDQLRSHYEVALVLAILVIHDDHELAGFEVGDRLRNGGKAHGATEYYRWRFRAT